MQQRDTPDTDQGCVQTHEREAIGGLVVATQQVESWLAYAAYRFGCFASYGDAARLRSTRLVVKVRQAADNLPAVEAEELRGALRRASTILNVRNTAVHAMPHRLDGTALSETDTGPPSRDALTVETLNATAAEAKAVVDVLRRHSLRRSVST